MSFKVRQSFWSLESVRSLTMEGFNENISQEYWRRVNQSGLPNLTLWNLNDVGQLDLEFESFGNLSSLQLISYLFFVTIAYNCYYTLLFIFRSGIGLLYVNASVWQMLRGSIIIFTGIFSVSNCMLYNVDFIKVCQVILCRNVVQHWKN